MVTRQGLPVYLFTEMTSLLMPRIFNVLSPIAVFVAVLFVYNRLISDRELVVMQSAGVKPSESAKPALIIGILMSVFNIYIMNWAIPQAESHFRELEWRVRNNITQMIFREGEFTPFKRKTVLVFFSLTGYAKKSIKQISNLIHWHFLAIRQSSTIPEVPRKKRNPYVKKTFSNYLLQQTITHYLLKMCAKT